MQSLSQSPTDPAFVQDPYPFYERARAGGKLFFWEDYGLVCATSATAVGAILRDRRFGREVPADRRPAVPDHLKPFFAVEAHSMLELEPPRHTRLRALVLRAFTSRRIAALGPEIAALSHDLIDRFPTGDLDLLRAFATRLPVTIICRLLGVPEERGDDLLAWSNAMVGMYQARRTRATEDAAVAATEAFVAFMRAHVEARRSRPADDLITSLIAAEMEGEKLSTDELITTCILLLNAGHEATVHTIGNGVKALLENRMGGEVLTPDRVEATVEEIFRQDPPLHLFTRWAYEDIEMAGHSFRKGDQVGCLLAAANRDPGAWDDPSRFNPGRPVKANLSFGAGLHFCVGAPLARLELQIALPILFARCQGLSLAAPPRYANLYHFHGLESLMVRAG
ncbi:cytochrome P450 [Albidovulum sp.]|uniref:cytochrome P450 n=1 Tax=Albidovulum sp. TaxID=1872424 RepID=UPI002B5818EF|nr:cytochrome P450 [Paracoccaceae bacterium]MCP5377166.1 cytochrome P450 [Paracoccaceae bacterium]HPE25874.1 cytochrome P450 [Albidovulum sp.]